MSALTFSKKLTATAVIVAALGGPSVAQAGLTVPGKHPDKHPDRQLLKHPDASRHPDFEPNIIAVVRAAL